MEGEWTDNSWGNGEWGGCGKRLNINCVPMDEDNGGWGKGRGWDGNLVEGSNGGEKMRNICNNMNNKDLFFKKENK